MNCTFDLQALLYLRQRSLLEFEQRRELAMLGRFLVYYRVSTARQGASGLGLEAQRTAVSSFIGHDAAVIAEFTEVESGRLSDRPQLDRALAAARVHKAPLVVAKVDRLTRSVAFLSRILEAGIEVRFADLPQIDGPTGRFMLQQMAAVAELEAGLISTRTKAALQAAKARGKRLGGRRSVVLSEAARAAGRDAQRFRANERAADLASIMSDMRKTGIMSTHEVAKALNERQIPTSRGGSWRSGQVWHLMKRLSDLNFAS